MSLWRRLFKGWQTPEPETRPGWVSFFSNEQFRTFRAIVERYFQKKRQAFTWGDGVLILKPIGQGGMHQLGLVNLAQLCARHEAQDWPAIVDDHFSTLEKSQNEQKVLELRLDDFARVAELLAVRLWPEGYLGELDGARMVHRRDLPGTITALVYDLPSSIRNVTPDETETWGKSVDELFRIALDNIRETCIPDLSEQDLGDGVRVFLFSDESFFVASHAFLLDDHPRCVGSFGSLVGIPHRHVLLAYPIETMEITQVIPRLIAVIAGMERDGPGSISPRLYWHQNGDFVDLPYHVEKNTLHFNPPEAFLEMLNLLGENDQADADEDDDLV